MAARFRSNVDHTRLIFKSIFVMNFPDNTTSKDLREVCQGYGTVVDVYIPNRKSKAGKRFAFVRFIKVDNADRLVGNLCTLWIGRNPNISLLISPSSVMVLDDSCVVKRDLDNYGMGEVKQFNNLRVLLSNEGFQNVKLAYLGGLWVMIELESWGEVMELEECKDDLFARKRICIKTKQEDNSLEKFKIIIHGKIFVLRAKELFLWSPVFNDVAEIVYCSDDESVKGVKGADENNAETSKQVNLDAKSDVEGVLETYFGEHDDNLGNDQDPIQPLNEKETSNDPFNIYDLLKNMIKSRVFYRRLYERYGEHYWIARSSRCFLMNCLSLNIQGLGSKAKKEWIRELNIKHKDSNVFHKEQHIISDNFVALYGTWNPNKAKLLMISIYAPQSATGKRSLWSYITSLITRWNGDCMVMGDFKEVRCMEDRMGSVFNVQGANEFNNFISNSRLVEIQLEGYSFTWSHPSATKMSKLDRFLLTEDDRNGMVRFKKKMQFLKKDIRVWVMDQKQKQSGRIKEIKSKLSDIDKLLDQGGVNDEILLSRMDLLKQLQDIKSSETRDCMQKAKIQWAIEGDENSKFFHGIINQKRANLAIKGVMVDGEWMDDPVESNKNSVHILLLGFKLQVSITTMVFKVDFAKAYDSIRWDYLDVVLRSFGFGSKWCSWISGSLISRMASILINGSPTYEFQFHCGLKQGDSLAPYIFILIMESLHLSFSRAVDAGIFTGIKIDSSLTISHLFYADDAVFIGEWSNVNLTGQMGLGPEWEGVFHVKDLRNLLDESFLPKDSTATRWVKSIPIKINVFAYKVYLNRLPTRLNLIRRGVQVPSLSCSVCNAAYEDMSHLLFSCDLANDVVRLVCRWWNLTWPPLGSYSEWLSWFNSIRLCSRIKGMLEWVFYVTWWCLWTFRNQLLFATQNPRKDVIFTILYSALLLGVELDVIALLVGIAGFSILI
nr:RNA-directed DNA polymerase, eukaryota [Tanacetum cinerariifolium]